MKKSFKSIILAFLAALVCVFACACAPSSIDKAKEKMEEADYTVISYSDDEAEGCIGGISASKFADLEFDTIYALLFDSKKAAKEYHEDCNNDDAVLDGKWVYWGTEDAIEVFKK